SSAPRAAPAPPTTASGPAGSWEESGAWITSVSLDRKAMDFGSQAVAAAPDRLDQLGIATVLFDLAAQAADLIVDRAIEQMRLTPLHHVEQTVAIEHLTRMSEEGDEQTELRGGNRHHRAVRIDQSALQRIKLPTIKFINRIFFRRFCRSPVGA